MRLIISNKKKHNKIEMADHETIGSLKKRLQLKIPLEYVVLKYNDEELDDSKSVRECGLSDNCKGISIHLKIWYNIFNCKDSDKMVLMKYKDRMKDLKEICIHNLKINEKTTKCTDIFRSKDFLKKYLKDENILFVIHTENGFFNKIEITKKNNKGSTKSTSQNKVGPEINITPEKIKDRQPNKEEPQRKHRQPNKQQTERDTSTHKTNTKDTTKGIPQNKEELQRKDKQSNKEQTDRDTATKETRISSPKISLTIHHNLDQEPRNKQFVVDVDLKTSVQTLRRMLSDNVQRHLCNVDIFHKTTLLGDGLLGDLGVRDKDTLTLKHKTLPKNLGQQFVVTVKNIGNNCEQPYMIGDLETVGALKSVLRDQHNVRVNDIRLYLGNTELRDEEIIRLLDIDIDSRITLVIKEQEEDEKESRIKIKAENRIADDRRCMEISVNRNDTVESLTRRLIKKFDMASDEFVLSFRGEIMKKENLIDVYSIKEKDEVVLTHSLLVKFFSAGDSGSAKVNRYPFVAEDRVLDLKAKISRRVNIESRFIILTFEGETLEDEMTLEEAAVENESLLLMVTFLAGGANM